MGAVRYGSEHGRHLRRVIHERPVVAGALDEKCDVHPGTSRYVSDAEIAADWPQSQSGQGQRRLADLSHFQSVLRRRSYWARW